jgi:hypothetical protein
VSPKSATIRSGAKAPVEAPRCGTDFGGCGQIYFVR